MSTVREQILATIATRLASVVGASVERSRHTPRARAEGIGIVVEPEEESVEFLATGYSRRDLVVAVRVIARGNVPDSTADPVVAGVHSAIMSDSNVGGLALRTIEESTKWEYDATDIASTVVEIRYRVRYLTTAADLTVRA